MPTRFRRAGLDTLTEGNPIYRSPNQPGHHKGGGELEPNPSPLCSRMAIPTAHARRGGIGLSPVEGEFAAPPSYSRRPRLYPTTRK
jgi:hypothetical protein